MGVGPWRGDEAQCDSVLLMIFMIIFAISALGPKPFGYARPQHDDGLKARGKIPVIVFLVSPFLWASISLLIVRESGAQGLKRLVFGEALPFLFLASCLKYWVILLLPLLSRFLLKRPLSPALGFILMIPLYAIGLYIYETSFLWLTSTPPNSRAEIVSLIASWLILIL